MAVAGRADPDMAHADAGRAVPATPHWLTILAFLTIVLVLGINFVAVRFSNRELPPFSGAALRFFLASAILFAMVRLQRLALPRGEALKGVLIYGVLSFGVTYACLYWGLVSVPAGMAAVLFATMPLITILMTISLGLERFRRGGLVGGMVVVVGAGLAFQDQLRADVPLPALLAIVLAAISAAAAGVAVKRYPRSHPIVSNAVGMVAGAVVVLVGALLTGEQPRLPVLTPTWLAVAWLVASSIVGFVLFIWLLARWTASATSYVTVAMPFVAVATGAVLAAEAVTPLFLAGSGLVLIGVYLGAIAGQPVPPPPPATAPVRLTPSA